MYTTSSTNTNQIVLPRKVVDRKKNPFVRDAFDLGASRAFSPDGKILAIGKSGARVAPRENSIQLFDTHTWKKIGVLKGHPHSVISLVFSSDGQRLISGNAGGGVIIYNVAKRSIQSSWWRGLLYQANVAFWDHDGQNTPIAVTRKINGMSPDVAQPIDGSVLAPEVEPGDFEVWNLATNSRLKVIEPPQPYALNALSLSLSPDGRKLAFLSTKPGVSNEHGYPYFVTMLNWEDDQFVHLPIDSSLFDTYGHFHTLQFISNDQLLLCDVTQDKLIVIGPQRPRG